MKPSRVASGVDRQTLRAAYDARVARDARADFLLREAESRMFDRLAYVKLDPVDLIVDVGCGRGDAAVLLGGRFPGARLVGLDLALGGLKAAAAAAREAGSEAGRKSTLGQGWRRRLARWGFAIGGEDSTGAQHAGGLAGAARGPEPAWVCGDAHALPIAGGKVDLLWSNLVAHWFDDPPAAAAEWRRVLRPGGLLMFSFYGVDTLREAAAADRAPLPPAYPDLHDWGDALVAAGFADPVMDVERLTLTYEDADALARDAAAVRAGFGAAAAATLPPGGRVSIELVYGHAWRPLAANRDDDAKPVRIVRREEIGQGDFAGPGVGRRRRDSPFDP
jgi:malonyl-CoA O-methyltransferase